MEIDKEKMMNGARQFAEGTREVLSKVDAKEAMRQTDQVTDKFSLGVFKFGKIISAIFMFVSILAIIGSLVYCFFVGAGTFKSPKFEDIRPLFESGGSEQSSRPKVSNEEFAKLRNKWGSKVDAVIMAGGLDAKDDYNEMIEAIARLDADMRGPYLNGALAFLKDFLDYSRSNPKVDFPGKAALTHRNVGYNVLFEQALEQFEADKEAASAKRTAALTLAGMSFLSLILFLIIPVLIKIEENTRRV